jgi:hypothetical protein
MYDSISHGFVKKKNDKKELNPSNWKVKKKQINF